MTNKCKKRRNLPQVTLSLSNKFKFLEEEDAFVGTMNEENCTHTKNEKRRRKKLRKKKEERKMKMNTEEELLDSTKENEQDEETLRKSS